MISSTEECSELPEGQDEEVLADCIPSQTPVLLENRWRSLIAVGACCAFMAVQAVLSPWRRRPLSGCVSGLLVAVVPLGERGHWGTWASAAAGCGLGTRSGQDLEHRFHQRGLRALWLCSMWDLPGPGMKPRVSRAGVGLFTTEPPGKPQSQTQDGYLWTFPALDGESF